MGLNGSEWKISIASVNVLKGLIWKISFKILIVPKRVVSNRDDKGEIKSVQKE